MGLKKLNGIEVFASGTWNGDCYTEQDLDLMVDAFNETQSWFKPTLKLGHNNEQQLAQKDGLPSLGYIKSLYRQGRKLFADFTNIPEKIYELIKKGAYNRVSSEIYWDIDYNGKVYGKLLSAVALLGEDVPAVQSLDDILALYGIASNKVMTYHKDITAKQYELNIEGDIMPETKIEDKKEEVKEEVKEVKEEKKEEKKAELSTKPLEDEIAKLKAENLALKEKEIEAKKAAYMADLEKEGLVTPSTKVYVEALLTDKKVYSIGDKEISKETCLKDMLKLYTKVSDVNLEEGSEGGVKDELKDKKEAIEKYMTDNKVTYKVAYKAIMK